MADSNGGQFYELFRELKPDERRRPERRRTTPQATPTFSSPTAQAAPPKPSASPLDIGFQRDVITVRVRRETLLLGALIACALLALFFVWGFRQGQARELARIANKPVKKLEKLEAAKPGQRSGGTRSRDGDGGRDSDAGRDRRMNSLRVMSYKDSSTHRAAGVDVLRFLRERGYDAYAAKSGSYVVLCVGEYENMNDPELVRLKDEIRRLRYKGERVFRDSYIASSLRGD
jgi:hypothetical protein